MKNRIVMAMFSILPITVSAQSLWTSAEVKMKLVGNLGVFAEGEYRTHDGMSATERWAGTVGLDYRLFPFLKAAASYTYIHQRTETETTAKGNIIPPYWQPKHRFSFSLTGSYSVGRFEFSLRERYQYTHRNQQYVAKYDDDGVTPKDDELVESKNKHTLRSCLQVEYRIKRTGFVPFCSVELYNSLTDGFSHEKGRWTIGTSYKFNKHHSAELFYRYIDDNDEDESAGNVIGIGYKFKF